MSRIGTQKETNYNYIKNSVVYDKENILENSKQ